MAHEPHPAATHHLPMFFTAPGETDILFGIVAVTLVVAILAAGVFFFWMHSLPERLVHDKVQFDIVAVLALLSLFTHIHSFWVAALLIALIEFPKFSVPDFSGSLGRIANSLEGLIDRQHAVTEQQQPLATQLQLPLDPKHGSIEATPASRSTGQPVTDRLATNEPAINQPAAQKG
jgi:multisubunit Na+/H+ antiporter MnhF subunit